MSGSIGGQGRLALFAALASFFSLGAAQAIETVTVTAERRSESIQDVPASVSAFDQSAITSLGMTNIQDLTRLTPGLSFTTSNGNNPTPIVAIRGISSFAGTATTGIYIDDTPIQVRFLGSAEAAGTAFPTLFDLDRIEVLRGPQGTLFGSSSEGGTIRFITRQPSLTEYDGHARGEVSVNPQGGFGFQAGAAFGGPIVDDKLGFRASFYAQQDGGWIDLQPWPGTAVTRNNSNRQMTYAGNLTVTWEAAPGLTFTPSVFWQHYHSDNVSAYWRNLSNPNDGDFVSGQLTPGPTTDEFVLTSLRAEWDLGGVTLFSNTSFLNHSLDQARDYTFGITELFTGDFTGPHTLTTSNDRNPQKQFTQELRFQSSDPDSDFRWVVGGFYQEVRQEATQIAVMPPQNALQDLITALFGVPIPVPLIFGEDVLPGAVVYEGFDRSRDTQWAGFGQVDYRITDEVTLTGGVRVAATNFSFANSQDGPFNSGPTAGSGHSSETDVLPKAGINYKPDNDLLFYATVSKGFRPGGANMPVPAICGPDLGALGLAAAPATYNSDHVWSYEAGSKGAGFDNRLQWAASVFYIDWKDIQNVVYLPGCGFHFIQNLGAAASRGFDLQASTMLSDDFLVSVALGYDDANYTQTVRNAAAASNIVTNGEALQAAPWQFTVAGDYTFLHFGDSDAGYLHIDDQYQSGYTLGNPADANYDAASSLHASGNVLSARVGARFAQWDVSLFAKNLLDAHPRLTTAHTSGSSLFIDATFPPRTVGLTATARF